MSVLATDNFNRADADPIGGNWTTETGVSAFKIVSNQAKPTDSAVDCGSYYNAVTWPNDQYSQAVLIAIPAAASSGDGLGVSCRVSASAKTNYEAVTGSGGAATALNKRVAGVFSIIGTSATTFAANDTIYIEVQGTAVKVNKNGSNLISVTDASIATGNAGLMHSSEGVLTATLDTWEGGDFTAADTLFAQAVM